MRRRRLLTLCVLAAALTGLSGCSSHQVRWTGGTLMRSTIDSLLGFPAATVVAGAGDALEAGNDEAHEARVEELASAYADFTQGRTGAEPDAERLPVVFEVADRRHAGN